MIRSFLCSAVAFSVAACSAGNVHPPANVAPAPPAKDDGKPAQGGEGGTKHAAALEQLKRAQTGPRVDKQNSIRIQLPDPDHWMRVKFWGIPSLVGFRYGKDHHAVVGAYITHVPDNAAPNACMKSFEDWATPLVEMFDVELQSEPLPSAPWNGKQVDVTIVVAKTATLAMRESYAVTYAAYPAWKGACLIVGAAMPARDEPSRAIEVRDRFAREILPKVEVIAPEQPKEMY